MPKPETIFYDGDCGLCHRGVKFVVNRDRKGRFVYAPLGGETFKSRLPECIPTDPEMPGQLELPDSILVLTADGLLAQSGATRHILRHLGGIWAAAGWLIGILPDRLSDWAYDRVAAIRHRLFAKPQGACPVLPAELRERFLP